MSIRVNISMSKIMRTSIKVGLRTYAAYANYESLNEWKAITENFSICSLFQSGS